jgi:predicted nuclease of predicted toxin-antitoxin system
VKFLVDMPLSPTLARWLIDDGHDAVHAFDIGMHRASDVQIIARANAEQRTIVPAVLDYPRLLALAGADEPSLILFRGGNWSDADIIVRMRQLLETFGDREIAHRILVVDRNRVRRRPLPIRL